VERTANGKEIKSAFRKKALKLHPDVNKAPDAKEQFMAAKEAFQVLSDAQSRATYDRQLSGGSGGFDWGNPFGGRSGSGSSSSAGSGQKGQRKAAEEPFYGFGALFDDLEKEWKERRRRRQKEPQSLWEELADIGEEFVEFLEKEIGLPAWEAEAEARSSDSGSRNEAARRAGYAQQRADAGAKQAAQQAEAGAQSAARDAQAKAKAAADDVEDALAELKRKLNKQ
jgi:molecular chaperone DnaJ